MHTRLSQPSTSNQAFQGLLADIAVAVSPKETGCDAMREPKFPKFPSNDLAFLGSFVGMCKDMPARPCASPQAGSFRGAQVGVPGLQPCNVPWEQLGNSPILL